MNSHKVMEYTISRLHTLTISRLVAVALAWDAAGLCVSFSFLILAAR